MERRGLLLSDSGGITIPTTFANTYGYSIVWSNWDEIQEAMYQLQTSEPDDEGYWDLWAYVLDKARMRSNNGKKFRLQHDKHVWLVLLEEEEN